MATEYVKNPFIAIFFGFIAGILASYFLNFLLPYPLIWIIAVFVIAILAERNFFKRNPFYYIYFVLPAFFLLGMATLSLHFPKLPENISDSKIFRAVIDDVPKYKDKSVQLVVKLEAYQDTDGWKTFQTKAVVYVKKDSTTPELHYGDLILIYGKFDKIKNSGNPYSFDYEKFMRNKGIFLTSFIDARHIKFLDKGHGNPFIAFALKIRQNFLAIYKRYGFEGQKFAVLSALTLGYRDEVSQETRQMFANTGAMHILAVSGLHVGIIYLILNSLLAFMDKKKHLFYFKSAIIIVSLWLFAAIAGLSPSVTRSALMFSLFVVGKILIRASSMYNIIFASAFILLLINPLDVFSVAFQLSYAAVLAIVFFQPHIYKMLYFKQLVPDKIWALTSVSIAAQLGTMPIGLYYFHQFPNYFFLTNIIVIPLASLILYTAVALFAVSFVPVIAKFFAFVLKLWLNLLFGGVKLIDNLPFATTKNIFITSTELFLLYAVILGVSLWLIYRKFPYLTAGLTSLLLFLLADIHLNAKNNADTSITFFNTRGHTAILIKSDTLYLIADDALFAKRKNLEYAVLPYLQANRITTLPLKEFITDSLMKKDTATSVFAVKNYIFKVGNLKFVYLPDDRITDYVPPQTPFTVDYVILAHNAYLKIDRIMQYFDFKEIIFDASNRQWKLDRWQTECVDKNIDFYDIANNGAVSINYYSNKKIFY